MTVQRLSTYYMPTLKETPGDAEIISHQLLLRAGYMRKTASGIYSLLPLGWRVVQKIEQIVREEMDALGALEMRLPIIQPEEMWRESGRWDAYGPELMRLKDRHDRGWCLGPTHEEIISALIATDIKSYKQLPFALYQMNTKFRDEIRPRFGLLRGREFLMKDCYSFHASYDDLDEYYELQAQAYGRICERMGLNWRRVEADSGQIGGKVTAEFHAIAEAGESDIVYCDCGYAADIDTLGEGASLEVCPRCGGALERARGIEVGQVFQVGPQYSETMGVSFADVEGVDQPPIMGCYGWGITRSLAASVEQNFDEFGIKWPAAIAPFEVCLIGIGKDDAVAAALDALACQLDEAGVEVVIDDRAERPGTKFADADLVGWPHQVVVGARGLEAGTLEVKERKTGEKVDVPVKEVASYLKQRLG
ncbi:MAG: proline--tRNA ligase [Coriobacteriia bacterium]|nr:proline--tRNA ligase [Coriobacteriia bacterium]MCL2536846.1 proline--tRNA ligase [Coriobacteriia bacterium]